MSASADPRVKPYKSHTSDSVSILVLPPERRDDAVRLNPSPGKQDFYVEDAEDAEKARTELRTVWRPARAKRPSSFNSASSAPLRPPRKSLAG